MKRKLCDFLDACVTSYHTVHECKNLLLENGFKELSEEDAWTLSAKGSYFFVRGGSLIAFKIPSGEASSFLMASAHSDSPAFFVKDERCDGAYTRLSVEKYGVPIDESWLDRPLSLGGRVMLSTPNGVNARLVRLDDTLLIPSLAPHLSKDMKNKEKDVKTDLLPLFSDGKKSLVSALASALDCKEEDILSHDLYLFSAQRAFLWNGDKYISSPRLDDLQCVFALLHGLLSSKSQNTVSLLAVFDHEEIGSQSDGGADSALLQTTMERISFLLGKSTEEYGRMLSASFMISADNAHAVHPAHPELADGEGGRVYMNGGIVIKHSAARRYATDAFSEAMFAALCKKENIPYQSYYNRADMRGGTTLGPISLRHISVPTADIGLAQLAMHSATETAGADDAAYLTALAEAYFSSSLSHTGDSYNWTK